MNHSNGLTALFAASVVVASVAPSASAETIPITGVQLNATDTGIEAILETPPGVEPQVFKTQFGNTLAIDIPNARLQLAQGEAFRRDNPAAGIARIEAVQISPNTVRLSIVGTDAVPNAEVSNTTAGTSIAISSGAAVSQDPSPEPTPAPPPPPDEPTPAVPEDNTIELVVTATRTEERQEDLARSVTVVTREEIEEQSQLSDNFADILGRTVPGLGPPTQSASTRTLSLRGRQPSILIDGIPLNSNRRDFQGLRGIDPSAVERVEVVRGPTAVFGSDATGGVINIITRQPTDKPFVGRTTFSLGPRLALSDVSDSFGGGVSQYFSGRLENFDYTLSASFDGTGNAIDGEGDIIPVGRSQGLDNLETLNLFGKVGVDFDDNQRLQLSVNHFNDVQDSPTLPDPSVNDPTEREKARSLDLGDLDIDELPGREETVVNLNYNHDDVFGSQASLQGFFQHSDTRTIPQDNRDTIFQSVSRTAIQSEKIGVRLEIETPLFSNANLLWGADYVEESIDNPLTIFDPDTFDASGGNEFEETDEAFFAPPYDLNTLGLFAQAQWEPSDRFALSGGARFERFELFADDYNVLGDINLPPNLAANENVEGGDLAFDDVVFNLGAVYDVTDNVSIFANFAQGFSAPDFGRVLRFPSRGFVSVSESVDVTEPVVVDNYELGVRGNWDDVQFSLAGFFTYSDLGENVRQSDEGPFLELERSPTRTYGVEATLDYQPSDLWGLGTNVTWVEGESNPEGDDEGFLALSTREIQPLKIGAYVENQTLPTWRNRLQVLVVGARDRAFDDEVDNRAIDSYTTFDYISSVDVGVGTLSLSVQNLLDNQYFTVDSQLQDQNIRNAAAYGRTFGLQYSVEW